MLNVKTFRVFGSVSLTNGKSLPFATVVEAASQIDAKAMATAQAYHDYGAQNIKSLSLCCGPVSR